MTAAEQGGFQISTIEAERSDLVLASSKQDTCTPGSIGAAAHRAAQVASRVLGVESQWAEDEFTGQLEAMKLKEIPEGRIPIVSVTAGAEDNNGTVLTPTHVAQGHDKLTTRNGQPIPETSIWSEMYAGRSAEWWNKTRPQGESRLVKAPLQLVLADAALRGTTKKWDKQQTELQKLVDVYSQDTTALEGMVPLAWLMMDADAIISGTERPDEQTVTLFVQHERDRSGVDGAYGPDALVLGGQAGLRGWYGGGISDNGFRAVMGQRLISF